MKIISYKREHENDKTLVTYRALKIFPAWFWERDSCRFAQNFLSGRMFRIRKPYGMTISRIWDSEGTNPELEVETVGVAKPGLARVLVR